MLLMALYMKMIAFREYCVFCVEVFVLLKKKKNEKIPFAYIKKSNELLHVLFYFIIILYEVWKFFSPAAKIEGAS